ncbi:hypothetical protein EPUS_07137 [Endocarpon pusillum Z07020]|uniref:Uncharacterized protein n=1 Tax=Endocarpon pusillum (strain Z07020 / HMAS-L-300199) TaxID=1263415 RepID=U1HIK7_ENDPU|nr:uncharacterized protein EPUS_07137 [Endocarpon pusillum Z07020]ERF68719.1 hypothetical protein EPUS_07137 [Endocarpon pusillum Z07020]
MQIQSLTTTHTRSPPSYSLNVELDTGNNVTSRLLDRACTQPRSCRRQKPTLLSTKRSSKTPGPACSWRERVLELFDPALRDAEDLMLSLPYTDIREKTYNFATILDGVPLSGSESVAARHLSGNSASCKARSNCTTSATTYLSQGDRSTALPHGGALIPRQRYNLPSMTKAIYTCYESVVAIVASYNQILGHDTEMQARRALTAALAAMDNIAS